MKTNKRKKILFAALLAVMVALPTGLSAQSDGFFSNCNDGGDRDGDGNVESGITNEGFTAPLGGGLAILVVSAAGYVVLKRKRED